MGDVKLSEEERVERLAKALYEVDHPSHPAGTPWNDVLVEYQDVYRRNATALLPVVDALLTEARATECEAIAEEIRANCPGDHLSKPCNSCRHAARIASERAAKVRGEAG